MKDVVTSEQYWAGRGLLGWSQPQLAKAATVSKSAIANLEAGRPLATNNHIAVDAALAHAGAELIDPNGGGLGVRFRDRDWRDDKSIGSSTQGCCIVVLASDTGGIGKAKQ